MKRKLLTLALLGAAVTTAALAQAVKRPQPTEVYKGIPKSGEVINNCAACGTTRTLKAVPDFTPVTDAMLRAPSPNDWAMMRGNYEGYGFSTLKQIDKTNVKNLTLVWSRAMEPGINESTPIVINGIMYLGNSADVIQAMDAASGDLLWEHRRKLPTREELHNAWGQRKRSVFVYGDKVYFVSWDNFLIALDAKTGREVWEVDRGGDLMATNTTGPIVVNGVVIAGSNCQEAPFGCFVTGNDAGTGKEIWRNHFIPQKGEKGDETWGTMPFEKRWMTGVWGPITYDPVSDMIFYGSSGIGPSSEAQRGQIGMSLYGTNTRYAVKPKTGEVVWQHQVLPSDNADQECTFEMIPITTKVAPDPKAEGMMAVGRRAAAQSRRTLTGAPCKTSIVWSFDLAKGDFLWAKSTVYQNLVSKIDDRGKVTPNVETLMRDINKTYRQCPTHAGGRDWPFAAYSPETNVLYLQLQNMCSDYKARLDGEPSPPRQYNTIGKAMIAEGKDKVGRIDAVSVETGKTLWSYEQRASNYSPILATASGLLFNGDMNRYFRAFDQVDGKILWETRLGSQVFGAPVTFSIGGRQYIAVAAGGGYNNQPLALTPELDQLSGGNAIYVFALPK
jgi:alcohol dehydrogenase (cytochrome c)